MAKHFRPWDPRQKWLLPPEITEFIPEGHGSHFMRDLVVEQLDLSAILATYNEERGYPPFHPAMMVALLLYSYTQGVFSSRKINAYIATGRQKHGTKAGVHEAKGKHAPLIGRMRDKLKRRGWRSAYRLRKQVVEPVFGQIKQAMGFRQFLLRGLAKVQAEWNLVCTAHNLLKLARSFCPQTPIPCGSRLS
jgi:hypothetical protein